MKQLRLQNDITRQGILLGMTRISKRRIIEDDSLRWFHGRVRLPLHRELRR